MFFENWFTSLSFGISFKGEVITAIGTIRTNRLGKDFTISKKDIKIDERGPIYLFYEGNDVCVVTWYDNDL